MSLENMYYVEKILDRRITSNSRIEYLIKWQNYSSKHNTWEPVSHLLNVSSVVKEFERKRAYERITDLPIEKILAKRLTTDGRVEYFVKWLDWLDEFNSWESELYFRKTSKLLEEFNKSCTHDDRVKTRTKTMTIVKDGFGKGLEVETILGVTNAEGDLKFLVEFKNPPEFKNSSSVELVANQIVCAKRPDLVIEFYEKRIQWAN